MPEIAIFYCQHQRERLNGVLKMLNGPLVPDIRKVALPCSGKMEVSFLLKALESGADGIALLGCPEAECHYLVGSTRAKNRVGYVQKILGEIGLSQDRVQRFVLENQNPQEKTDALIAWVKKIQAMGGWNRLSSSSK